MTHLEETLAAALELARASRWNRALSLLDTLALLDTPDATTTNDRARIALTAVEVALESDWFAGTTLATGRLATAERLGGSSWDLEFLRLRHDYLGQLGTFQFGPDGKDPEVLAQLRKRATDLAADTAADERRRGWARMYLGLILDNLFADREAAPQHYEAALRAGESTDDLLTREALRHLADHDRDRGDLVSAKLRWERATALGARAGLVAGTLSQQILLAVLARDTGDDRGATQLAEEIARWSDAIGATRLHTQAKAFLSGAQIA
jgi:hypothetical protein